MSRVSRSLVCLVSVVMSLMLYSCASGPQAASPCVFGANCILNPSFLVSMTAPATDPTDWSSNTFGTSNASFAMVAGRTDDRAASVTVTSYTGSQDAKWRHDPIPVAGGQYFAFQDWYQSNVPTEIDVYFMGGDTDFQRLATIPPSPGTWAQTPVQRFLVPPGATAMTVVHNLVGAGTLTTDDYSLTLDKAPVFAQGIVSLTFDDGWKSIFDNAIPVLNAAISPTNPNGLKSTQYITTDPVIVRPDDYARFMSVADILELQREGHDVAAHTRSHRDLVHDLKDAAGRRDEIDGSRRSLLEAGITTVDNFAYPYGQYDATVRALVAKSFLGARSVERGYNFTNTDRYALKIQYVDQKTTPDQVKGWIDFALANRLWLILTFHRVEQDVVRCADPANVHFSDADCIDVGKLTAIADYLKTKPFGTVLTVHQALTSAYNSPEAMAANGPTPAVRQQAALPEAPPGPADPESTLTGMLVTPEHVAEVAYEAGFRTEEQLLPLIAMAVSESQLWTQARNWHPEQGYRPATDQIGPAGPTDVWSTDHRQMHSDRGLWQIASRWFPQFPDGVTDDPAKAAKAMFVLTKGGTDFSLWDSFRSGHAQKHYDEPFEGWPPLRPFVKNFLTAQAVNAVQAIPTKISDLNDLARVTSVNVVAIDPTTPSDAALNQAVTDHQSEIAELHEAIKGNLILKTHIDAMSLALSDIVGMDVAGNGQITIYTRT